MLNKNFLFLVGLLFGIAVFYINWDMIKAMLLKFFKKKKSELAENYVQVCIYCGSTNVRNDLSKDMMAWEGSTRLECADCGYSSVSFPIIPKTDLKHFLNKIKNRTDEEKKSLSEAQLSKGINLRKIRIHSK